MVLGGWRVSDGREGERRAGAVWRGERGAGKRAGSRDADGRRRPAHGGRGACACMWRPSNSPQILRSQGGRRQWRAPVAGLWETWVWTGGRIHDGLAGAGWRSTHIRLGRGKAPTKSRPGSQGARPAPHPREVVSPVCSALGRSTPAPRMPKIEATHSCLWWEHGRLHGARTGLKSMRMATPSKPIMEMAWSMPPLVTPTYLRTTHKLLRIGSTGPQCAHT